MRPKRPLERRPSADGERQGRQIPASSSPPAPWQRGWELRWKSKNSQALSRVIEAIKARGSNAGRAAIDPHILFALWLYATLEGVGSGREVARLVQQHDAYRWICGGASVNYHALNDFRSGNEALMDELLTDNVAALAAAGAIALERVAQDGMRVRASAGAASFRRQARLQEHLHEAGELVQTLKQQARNDPGAAQRRAARSSPPGCTGSR